MTREEQLRKQVEVLREALLRASDEEGARAALETADRVLVVIHSVEVQELCDERIEVGNG